MIGVHATLPRYRTATAELPLSTRTVEAATGAIVVVDGSRGWPERCRRALQAGAVALVVADPTTVDDASLAALDQATGRTPILLDRPRLRPDLVADAVSETSVSEKNGQHPARHVTADAVAPASELPDVLRDAIGWLRLLAGGDLELRAAASSPHGMLALLEEPVSTRAASVTASVLIGSGGARLRALAVGESRVEVELDAASDVATVEIATGDGVLRRPRRRESSERQALHRALAALAAQTPPTDLRDFRHDAALAAGVIAAG